MRRKYLVTLIRAGLIAKDDLLTGTDCVFGRDGRGQHVYDITCTIEVVYIEIARKGSGGCRVNDQQLTFFEVSA